MRSILLDESVPFGVTTLFGRDECLVKHVSATGFAGMSDRRLLETAIASGCDVLVTCDQNLVWQQNVGALPFGILVICTNNWPTILGNRSTIETQVELITPGSFREVLKDAHLTRYGRRPKHSDPAR